MTVAAAVGTEVGLIYCCSRLRGGGGKRSSSSTPLPVVALVYVGVW